MNFAHAERIVAAVLFEGYMLYPYRPSSIKNRQRWTFGGVYPQGCSLAQDGSEPCSMQTQCLVQGDSATRVTLRLGFLHLVEREVGEFTPPLPAWSENLALRCLDNAEPSFRLVDVLQIGEQRYLAWQEAVERQVDVNDLSLASLTGNAQRITFAFPAMRTLEPLGDAAGEIRGVLIRTQRGIEGCIELRAEAVAERARNTIWRLTAQITNLTPMQTDENPPLEPKARNTASLFAFVSTHSIIGIERGEFFSLLDPPESLRVAASACENLGTYPVLVGCEGQRDTILSSPIILYDYPQIAPESPGDLFDGTEIDEILSLRILAMTDEEKREMTAVDARCRTLLERTEALSADDLARLHGTLRRDATLSPYGQPPVVAPLSVNPALVDQYETPPWAELDDQPRLAHLRVGDVDLHVGDAVRLCPRGNADIMDIALKGMTATIESIERDFEDRIHIAVTVNDDPGREFGLERMPGHRFFFSPEEIEPITSLRTLQS